MIKKTLCLLLTMTAFAYAETHTVNPGGGADYTSLETCVNAHEGTLSEPLIINCSGSTADGMATVHNYTTTVTNNIQINGDLVLSQSTALRYNTTYYHMVATDHWARVLRLDSNNIIVNKMQFDVANYATTGCGSGDAGKSGNIIKNSIAYNSTHGASVGFGGESPYTAYNCVAYNLAGSAFYIHAFGTTVWSNNTAYNCGTGFNRDGGDALTATNCIANSNTNNYNGTITTSHCASDTSDELSGTGDRDGTDGDVTFVSVTGGSEDFHLATNDANARNLGTSLAGTFTIDIDGETRGSTWDIGADEYSAGGGTPSAAFPQILIFE